MKISVVVPVSVQKFGPRLENCLASVRRQNVPAEVEIIVAWVWRRSQGKNGKWRGNSDKHRARLKKTCKKYGAKLVEGNIPGGPWEPSFARNLGFREATGGILCCLDADAVLHLGTLRCILEAIKMHRETVVRAPTRMKNAGPAAAAFQPGAHPKKFQKAMLYGKVAPGPGSLIAAPREAVFGIRGWDERFYGYGPADWDYFQRLVQWGCRPRTTVQEANIYAVHQYHKPRREAKNKRLRARNRKLYKETLSGKRGSARNKNRKWGGEL